MVLLADAGMRKPVGIARNASHQPSRSAPWPADPRDGHRPRSWGRETVCIEALRAKGAAGLTRSTDADIVDLDFRKHDRVVFVYRFVTIRFTCDCGHRRSTPGSPRVSGAGNFQTCSLARANHDRIQNRPADRARLLILAWGLYPTVGEERCT